MPRPTRTCYYILPQGMLVRWTGKRLLFAERIDRELKAYLNGDEVQFPQRQMSPKPGVIGTYPGEIRAIMSDSDLQGAIYQLERGGAFGVVAVERIPFHPGATQWRP